MALILLCISQTIALIAPASHPAHLLRYPRSRPKPTPSTHTRRLHRLLTLRLLPLQIRLNILNLRLLNLPDIHPHGLHPLRVNHAHIQIRTGIPLCNQRLRRAHAQIRKPILPRGAHVPDVKILIAHLSDRLNIMQTAPRPHRIHPPRLVILIPTPTLLRPDGMPHPLLTVLVELIRHLLPGGQTMHILALQLPDHLHRIQTDRMQGTHHGAVLHGPVGADEGEEIREVRDGEPHVPLRADLPFVREVDAAAADDGEAGPVGDVEARRADDGVDFSVDAVAAGDARGRDQVDGGEVDVDVGFLDGSVGRRGVSQRWLL